MTVKLLKGSISKDKEVSSDANKAQAKAVSAATQALTPQAAAQRSASVAAATDAVITTLRIGRNADPAPKIRDYDKARALADDVHSRLTDEDNEEMVLAAHDVGPTTGKDLLL